MPDIFDEVQEAPAAANSAAGDVFDAVAPAPAAKGDVFDRVAEKPATEKVTPKRKQYPLNPSGVLRATTDLMGFLEDKLFETAAAPGDAALRQYQPDLPAGLKEPRPTAQDLNQSLVTGYPTPEEIQQFMLPSRDAAARQLQPELPPAFSDASDTVPGHVATGLARKALQFGTFLTSPKGVVEMPAAAVPGVGAALKANWGLGMVRGSMDEAARAAQLAREGKTGEAIESGVGSGVDFLMAGTMGREMMHGRGAEAPSAKVKAQTPNATPAEPVSEFGGVKDLPVPEKPETIEAQLAWLKEGKRKAVLVTPGGEAPAVPEGMEQANTTAGTIIFDPEQVTKDEVHAAVSADKLGDLLGYGIGKRPAPGTEAGVVVVRGADGTEKQAAVTDENHLPGAVKAAGAVADEGDTVTLEDGQDVIAERKGQSPTPAPSRIEQKAFREMLDNREDVPAELVKRMGVEPGALPEGYDLQGEKFVFKEPAPAETEAQRMVRENQEAVARLRERKRTEGNEGNEDPDWNVPEEEAPTGGSRPTERASEGTPLEIQDERPPDILDWIQGHFSEGVRTTSAADYGELVNQFADASIGQKRGETRQVRKLLSEDRGEAADQVLKSMHDEGVYRRLASEDDLLGAMVRAAEERKTWEAQRKAAPDRIEAWLNRAIDATKPEDWTGQTNLGLAKLPIWLAQQAAHDALRVVRAAYRGGRNLMDAISAGVDHVRGMNLPGFNAGELQDWLAGTLAERETGQKVAASTAVSEPVKDSITQYLYERRSNATDEELARGIVSQQGLDGAMEVLRNPPGNLAPATWSKLLGEVTRGLAERERDARMRGDETTAGALAQRQAALWDEHLPKITEMAQGLQALTDIVDMSPDAQVARLKQRLERAADERVGKVGPEVEVARGALEEGRNAGVEEVRQDPAVNEAARQAVDGAVGDSEEVKSAVVMELAGPWAESPHILLHAKQSMQGMLADVMRGRSLPKGMNAAQHARAILGDLSQRAAQIFAGHIQGAEPGVTLVKKLQERLGLSEARGRELATALSQEWARQLKAAQAKIPKRIAAARVARERNLGQSLDSPTAAVDAAIRRQLDALNLKLGEVLKQEAGRQEQTGGHVAERIVQASGLTGEAADTFRTVLKNRWDAIVTAAQRRALERLQGATGLKVSGKVKGAFEKAVELERLGALTSERFYDVVKQQLKLKRLTAADAAELRRLVRRAQELPEGFLRQQAATDVLKFTERASGNASLRDLPMAIWYGNVLSGLTTYAKIGLENANLLAANTVASFLARPRELLSPLDALQNLVKTYKRGLAKGALQAASTLKSGTVTGVWETPRTPTILEMKPFGERFEPLNFWKWFTRGISTAHEATFKPAWEFKQSMLARDVARSEGLKGKALQQRVADLMADTEGHWTQAKTQALNELRQTGTMSRLNLARRTREILEQQREQNMPGSTDAARDYALRSTYLNEPYGFLGLIARGMRGVIEKARKEYPVLGTGVKTQIPFTTVVANILNEKLNWTPVGLGRAAVSHKTGELYGRPVMPGDRAELYAKAIVGTLALGALAELFGDHIHGNGPSDPKKRKQLQAAGWVPHSIEWDGRHYSYMNTPAGLGLAVVGNVNDWHRYGKGDQEDGVGRAAFAAKATANAIVSQGMLDSLKRVFESLGSESTTEGADKLQKLAARTASSFAVPNLVQQVDRIFDPTVYDKTGMQALVRGQIPFVRRSNKPALTVLGDPVQVGPFSYWGGKLTDDPLLRTIAERQAWVPEPSKNQIIGDKKRGPDYYRAMTPDEYYDWIAMSGRQIRQRLTENLDVIATGEPDKARKFVETVAEEERAKAKKTFE